MVVGSEEINTVYAVVVAWDNTLTSLQSVGAVLNGCSRHFLSHSETQSLNKTHAVTDILQGKLMRLRLIGGG